MKQFFISKNVSFVGGMCLLQNGIIEPEIVISIVSVVIAFVSVSASLYYARRTRAESESGLILEEKAFRKELLSDIRCWADDVICTISDAIFLDFELMSNSQFRTKKQEILGGLSALVERGRLFFANVSVDRVPRLDRPSAYRGYRQKVLDWIVSSFNTVDKSMIFEDSKSISRVKAELWSCRENFVSFIQDFLDPHGWRKELDQLAPLSDG